MILYHSNLCASQELLLIIIYMIFWKVYWTNIPGYLDAGKGLTSVPAHATFMALSSIQPHHFRLSEVFLPLLLTFNPIPASLLGLPPLCLYLLCSQSPSVLSLSSLIRRLICAGGCNSYGLRSPIPGLGCLQSLSCHAASSHRNFAPADSFPYSFLPSFLSFIAQFISKSPLTSVSWWNHPSTSTQSTMQLSSAVLLMAVCLHLSLCLMILHHHSLTVGSMSAETMSNFAHSTAQDLA